MTTNEIRETYLKFFESNGHTRVASSSVIPWGDPTLMFTNAGMNQFKDVFLGSEKREYIRATTCQKCIRAGGKHNDLDEVGKTTRHATFLEMLGNFSFGDYFKRDAINFAWTFLTKVIGLNPEKLYPSIYSTDDEAFKIWTEEQGVPAKRILRFGNIEKGDDENFWSMGPVGPCGPCSEIYIDRGPSYGPDDPYEALAKDTPRFLELWNIVFMQFNRTENGTLTPLPKPSIDTGLGLERMAMILQGRENIFETDILGSLAKKVSEMTGKAYDPAEGMPFRVAADHIRTLTFALADGAIPSNEGRGYVLRRILRRGCRYLRKLDVREPMLYKMVSDVVDLMGAAYPEISARADYISLVIKGEEERFLKTLDQGVDLFEKIATGVVSANKNEISGEDAFKLYDTFGFPVDLTRIMSEEKGLKVDMTGFEKAMEVQRTRAREASSFAAVQDDSGEWTAVGETSEIGSVFAGYDNDSVTAGLLKYRETGNGMVELIFDKTPFYALSGGQASDTGTVSFAGGALVMAVKDLYDRIGVGRVHLCEIPGGKINLDVLNSQAVIAIDKERRRDIERNHTATHLLQAALQKKLGDHVRQSGSAVDNERLRFDFNHFSSLTREEIEDVEKTVNYEIIEDMPVTVTSTTMEEARNMGAMSLFEEKYGETVRLVRAGDFSSELCGGTHVSATGRIGSFRIVSESSVAAGIRRIEAVTGMQAYGIARKEHNIIGVLAQKLNAVPDQISERVDTLSDKIKELEKEIKKIRSQRSSGDSTGIEAETVEIQGVKVSFGKVAANGADELKSSADAIRDKLKSGVVVLGSIINEKVSIVAAVTDDIIKSHSLRAGDIVKIIAEKVGGSGGGRPNFAMAGGKDPEKLDSALTTVPEIIAQLIGNN